MSADMREDLDQVERRLAAALTTLAAGGDADLREVRAEAAGAVETLRALAEGIEHFVADSVPLAAGAARADENLQVAALGLQSPDQGSLTHVIFHLRRATEQLRALEADVVERTRETDQTENRRHFMSG